MPIRFSPDALADVLPAGGFTWLSSCSAESSVLAEAIDHAGARLGAMTFGAIFVAGLNRRTYLASPEARTLTFFLTPELRAAGERVEFLPLCYQDVLAELKRRRPDAVAFMCAPPDANGNCSFGPSADFLPELWRDAPVRIAHINPLMPATKGDPGIPFAALTAYCEAEQPLLTGGSDEADAVATAIAASLRSYVQDGATLQVGLGKIPGAVLRSLTDRRNLRLHTGLVGDAVLDLIASAALAGEGSATVGCAIGTKRLYDALGSDVFQFRPVNVTHDAATLGAIADLITINSALEVDLFGQAYAELPPGGLMSGPGGASDFARGARMAHGLRVVALPADGKRGTVSRIVAPDAARGPVSLGRMDIDLVVTEHGVADLRFKSHEARASALIAVAAPAFREGLSAAWKAIASAL